MPRERIHHGKIYGHVPIKAVDGAPDGYPSGYEIFEYRPGDPSQVIAGDVEFEQMPSLDVSWNRDAGWVQVSIDISREKWIEKAAELAKEVPEGANKNDVAGLTISRAIYTDVLTRKEINDMIKVLRRARDTAYGSDE